MRRGMRRLVHSPRGFSFPSCLLSSSSSSSSSSIVVVGANVIVSAAHYHACLIADCNPNISNPVRQGSRSRYRITMLDPRTK